MMTMYVESYYNGKHNVLCSSGRNTQHEESIFYHCFPSESYRLGLNDSQQNRDLMKAMFEVHGCEVEFDKPIRKKGK